MSFRTLPVKTGGMNVPWNMNAAAIPNMIGPTIDPSPMMLCAILKFPGTVAAERRSEKAAMNKSMNFILLANFCSTLAETQLGRCGSERKTHDFGCLPVWGRFAKLPTYNSSSLFNFFANPLKRNIYLLAVTQFVCTYT